MKFLIKNKAMQNNNQRTPATETSSLNKLLDSHNILFSNSDTSFCLFQAIADYKKGEVKGLNFEQINMIQLVLETEGMSNLQRAFNNA